MKKDTLPLKEAKKKFIKSSFYCGILAIMVCWFMKLFGFDYFGLDLDNKFFNDLDILFINNGWLKQIYFSITLYFQMYFMFCMIHRVKGKECYLYILYCMPLFLLTRFLTSKGQLLYNYSMIIEIIVTLIILCKFKYKKILSTFIVIFLNIIYQAISINTRSLELKTHSFGFVSTQILNIDYYILLYLSTEVLTMDDGTFFFFGLTAWLYYVAGFIVGIFKLHPIKTAREWYAKGKEKENARKTKRELKKSQKQ